MDHQQYIGLIMCITFIGGLLIAVIGSQTDKIMDLLREILDKLSDL